MTAADSVIALGYLVAEASEIAQANHFSIDDAGVVADLGIGSGVPADQVESVQAERERTKAELDDRARQIIERANEIDSALADVLRRVERGEISDGGATDLAAAAQAGAAQVSLHDQLLAKYRVSPDPDGMVDVPFTKDDITASEFNHLMDLGLLGAKDAYDIYQHSLDSAKGPFNEIGGTNGHTDAVRHVLWSATLANRFGQEWTEG